MPNIAPAYQASKGSPLDVDKAFYRRIAQELGSRRLIEQLVVSIRSGRAWRVPAGHVFRIVTIDGPQVGDLNIWNLHNPRERMWASRSRQLQASHVSTFDRLWSNLPYLRPLVTITDDSLAGYGVDEFGGRVHDLLGTRCDPYVNRLLTGEDFNFHCHSNLVRAVAPPFPGAFTEVNGCRLAVLETRVDAQPARFPAQAPCLYAADGEWYADCVDGRRLKILRLAIGGEPVTPERAPPALARQPVRLS